MLRNVAGVLAQRQMAKSVECCGISDSMTVKSSGKYYINVHFLLLMLVLNTSLEPLPSPREELFCSGPGEETGPYPKGLYLAGSSLFFFPGFS